MAIYKKYLFFVCLAFFGVASLQAMQLTAKEIANVERLLGLDSKNYLFKVTVICILINKCLVATGQAGLIPRATFNKQGFVYLDSLHFGLPGILPSLWAMFAASKISFEHFLSRVEHEIFELNLEDLPEAVVSYASLIAAKLE